MHLDPGIVYVLLAAVCTAQLALLGWILREVIHNKTKAHRFEGQQNLILNRLEHIENRLDALANTKPL